VARTSDVAGYLAGVGQRRMGDIGPGAQGWGSGWGSGSGRGPGMGSGSGFGSGSNMGPGMMTDLAGGPPAVPPTQIPIWVAQASGTDPLSPEWTPADGNWTVVVIRTDGTPGVAATMQVGATVPGLTWVSVGLLAGGAVVLAGGWAAGRVGRAPGPGAALPAGAGLAGGAAPAVGTCDAGTAFPGGPRPGAHAHPGQEPLSSMPQGSLPLSSMRGTEGAGDLRRGGLDVRLQTASPHSRWGGAPGCRVGTAVEEPVVDDITEGTGRDHGNGAGPAPRIVVGVDGSAGSRAALVQAMALPVDFYWTDPWLMDRNRVDSLRSDTEARVRELVEETRRDPAVAEVPGSVGVPAQVIVVPGTAAEHLAHIAEGADLLVVGSRGRGVVRSTVLGSVALHCSTHARCPVLVVHPGKATMPLRVVVGVDDSATSRAALPRAVDTAAELGAQVEAVVAFHPPDHWIDLYAMVAPPVAQLRARAAERGQEVAEVLGLDVGVPVRVVTVEGPAGEVLVQRSAGAAMLVVGSRSRSTLPGVVLGSVALHCVLHAPGPVLVVHPERAAHEPAPAPVLAWGAP
jgi:nucleotide-binding universal stress UspA family protein